MDRNCINNCSTFEVQFPVPAPHEQSSLPEYTPELHTKVKQYKLSASVLSYQWKDKHNPQDPTLNLQWCNQRLGWKIKVLGFSFNYFAHLPVCISNLQRHYNGFTPYSSLLADWYSGKKWWHVNCAVKEVARSILISSENLSGQFCHHKPSSLPFS